MSIKLKPFSDFLILEPVEEASVTEMGLVIPDNAGKDKPRIGKVLHIGPAVTFCKEGELVLFSPYTGETVTLQRSPTESVDLKVVREDALIALYEETHDETK